MSNKREINELGLDELVFGAPLQKLLELEQRSSGIPAILERTMQIIREKGLNSEGLFRVGGDKGTIFEYKAAWDKGMAIQLDHYCRLMR
jgi:Rho GTPase-activating protein 1